MPDSDKSAVLNKDTRKVILLSRAEKHEYSVSNSFNAFVSSIDKGQEKFKLDIEGSVIECSFEVAGDFIKTIFAAFTEHDSNTLLSIKATSIYDEHDNLIKIEAIEAMDVLDPFDVNIRLNYLSKIKDNWYNGYGLAPNVQDLSKFGEYFSLYFNQSLSLPAIFPTVEGNIQLEWNAKENNLVLDVILSEFLGELISSKDSLEETDIDLAQHEGWKTINDKVYRLINEQ